MTCAMILMRFSKDLALVMIAYSPTSAYVAAAIPRYDVHPRFGRCVIADTPSAKHAPQCSVRYARGTRVNLPRMRMALIKIPRSAADEAILASPLARCDAQFSISNVCIRHRRPHHPDNRV